MKLTNGVSCSICACDGSVLNLDGIYIIYCIFVVARQTYINLTICLICSQNFNEYFSGCFCFSSISVDSCGHE